jgi:hypothetical protein
LLCLGFRLKTEQLATPPSTTTETTSENDTKEATVIHGDPQEDNLPHISVDNSLTDEKQLDHLCVVTGHSVVLIMEEPNPESADGMGKWIAWFDGLKTTRDYLCDLIGHPK